mmetsp:Transcript_16363/g.25790  ORF Transcript_16363/g.25790 Transcript_16363/m.25790 type:complete len:81 (-) Transcript_16363:52-294(-)
MTPESIEVDRMLINGRPLRRQAYSHSLSFMLLMCRLNGNKIKKNKRTSTQQKVQTIPSSELEMKIRFLFRAACHPQLALA